MQLDSGFSLRVGRSGEALVTSLALTSGTGPALRLPRRVGKLAIFLAH